jgi:ABC-type spermidine/putrescine transport system permease subunit II
MEFTGQPSRLAEQALKTLSAAAIAGIVFAVLFATNIGLMRLAIPEGLEVINLSMWVIMVFPAWVFAVSVYILIERMRGKGLEADAAVGAGE